MPYRVHASKLVNDTIEEIDINNGNNRVLTTYIPPHNTKMSLSIQELEKKHQEASTETERLEVLLELVEYHTNDDYVEAWRCGQEALDLATVLGSRENIARSHEGLARTLWKLAEYTEALDHYETALDGFLGVGNLYGVAKCYCGMGVICGVMEEYGTALEHFDEGLSAARRSSRTHLAATISGNIGHVYFKIGRYAQAIECFEHGLSFFQENKLDEGIANMLSGLAGVYVYQGEHAKGLELVRRALEVHKRGKNPRGIAVSMMNIGIALQKMGKLEKAKSELKSALNYSRSINLKMTEHDILKNLSQLCSELGQEVESREYLELYLAAQREEKKMAVQKKAEQFRQRQQIREMQPRKS